jgi:hypothetical protein
VYDGDSAALDVPAGFEPGCGPVRRGVHVARVHVARGLVKSGAWSKRGFDALPIGGVFAERDTSAARATGPG